MSKETIQDELSRRSIESNNMYAELDKKDRRLNSWCMINRNVKAYYPVIIYSAFAGLMYGLILRIFLNGS